MNDKLIATKFIIKTKQDNMYHGNIRDLIDHLNVMRYNECLHDIISIETQQSDKMCVCKQCCDIIKSQRELFMVKPVNSIYNRTSYCDYCLENGFEELFDIQF
jgi:hypothetical protein